MLLAHYEPLSVHVEETVMFLYEDEAHGHLDPCQGGAHGIVWLLFFCIHAYRRVAKEGLRPSRLVRNVSWGEDSPGLGGVYRYLKSDE